MTLPYANVTPRDGGLAFGPGVSNIIAIIACSSTGTAAAAPLFTKDPNLVKSTFGEGKLVDAACVLIAAGVTVGLVRATGSTAGAAGDVTAGASNAGDGVLTVAGAAYDDYEVIVEMTTSADSTADNDAYFRYSLDGGDTYTPPIAVPEGAGSPAECDYVIPGTNLTLTFTDNDASADWVDGDTYSFNCTGPVMSTSDFDEAWAALIADPTRFKLLWVPQNNVGAAGAATFAGAVKTAVDAVKTSQKRWTHAVVDANYDPDADPVETEADLKAAFTAVESERLSICSDYTNFLSASNPGKAYKRGLSWEFVLRVATSPIHEDPGKVRAGGMKRTVLRADGSSGLYRDEFLSEGLDAERFNTGRTYPGVVGYHITQGLTHALNTSDFHLLPNQLVMNVACATLYAGLASYANYDFRAAANSDLHAADAQLIKSDLGTRLSNALQKPGHISGLSVEVVRDNDPLSSQSLQANFSIQPKGYFKNIDGSVGFVRSLEG